MRRVRIAKVARNSPQVYIHGLESKEKIGALCRLWGFFCFSWKDFKEIENQNIFVPYRLKIKNIYILFEIN